MRARCLPALLVALGALGAPAVAAASTVSFDGTTVKFTAAPGERNDVSVRLNAFEGDANRYYFDDDGATLTAGTGCETDPNRGGDIQCQAGGPVPVVVDLGDGDDRASMGVVGALVGGPGNDLLRGGIEGPQTFDGGDGNDTFEGDATGFCTDGNRGRGADSYAGGAGTDLVRYDDEDVGPITVTIDGVANDGAANEGDNVGLDVEGVNGTDCALNDITGSAGPNTLLGEGTLNGLGGDDVLTGSGSADTLSGGEGNDKLVARSGNDKLDGGPGDDFIEGGFDDDMLEGGPGKDSFVGDETASNTIGTGNDIINANDGVGENISCGPGSDVANVDALDTVPVDTQNLCEVVNKAAGAPAGPTGPVGPGTPGGGGAAVAFPVTLASSSVKASRRGRVTLTLRCRATDAAGCNGVVRVASTKKVRIAGRSRTFVLGTRNFSIARGKSARVTFTLSKTNRSALRRLKRVALSARFTERAAKPRLATRTFTLRR